VKITRIRRTGVSAIGFRETAEKGKVTDYFVAKKDGVNGMPAPVKIFFPEGGGEPKISYVAACNLSPCPGPRQLCPEDPRNRRAARYRWMLRLPSQKPARPEWGGTGRRPLY
jgi:hypothetical protein